MRGQGRRVRAAVAGLALAALAGCEGGTGSAGGGADPTPDLAFVTSRFRIAQIKYPSQMLDS